MGRPSRLQHAAAGAAHWYRRYQPAGGKAVPEGRPLVVLGGLLDGLVIQEAGSDVRDECDWSNLLQNHNTIRCDIVAVQALQPAIR